MAACRATWPCKAGLPLEVLVLRGTNYAHGCRPQHVASSIQAAAAPQVTAVASGLKIPLTCKIRIYPELDKTVAYAQVPPDLSAS